MEINYGNFFTKSEKNKNKLRIYSKNYENFKNSKPKVQFYWFLEFRWILIRHSFVSYQDLKHYYFYLCDSYMKTFMVKE